MATQILSTSLQDGQYYVTERLKELSEQHNISDYEVEFSNRMSRCLAQVQHIRRNIYTMAYKFKFNNGYLKACVEHGELNALEDTILHEVAHALAGGGHNHDAYWQQVAHSIGCEGKRLKKCNFYKPKARKIYVYECEICGCRFEAGRKYKHDYLHSKDKGRLIFKGIEEK